MVQIPLKLLERDFVATFKLTVFIACLLNGIICQVGKTVGKVIQREFLARSTQVTVRVDIAFDDGVYGGEDGKDSYVELPRCKEQRSVNILLNYESIARPCWLFDLLGDFLHCVADIYATATVWILARFYYPNIPTDRNIVVCLQALVLEVGQVLGVIGIQHIRLVFELWGILFAFDYHRSRLLCFYSRLFYGLI